MTAQQTRIAVAVQYPMPTTRWAARGLVAARRVTIPSAAAVVSSGADCESARKGTSAWTPTRATSLGGYGVVVMVAVMASRPAPVGSPAYRRTWTAIRWCALREYWGVRVVAS
jgi:hypothetical protein